MFTKHKIYYTVEAKEPDESSFNFVCSYSTYSEAVAKLEELKELSPLNEYRILKIEKDIEELT